MKYKFEELIESISDTRKINKSEVILINTSDVENGAVLNHKYVKNQNLRGQFKKRFKKGDILYSEIRPKNKRFAYINFDSEDYIASTKLMVLRKKSALIDNDYLFYLLKSDSMINKLQMLAESRSGTFPQITFDELKRIEVEVPELEQQRRIIKILVSLDKKIELNNQINDNLLKFIKAFYIETFKDEQNKKKIKEVAEFSQGVQVPIEHQSEIFDNGLIRFIRIVDLTQGSKDNIRYIENKDRGIVDYDDVFMIRYGSPGILGWNYKGIIANNLFKINPKTDETTKNYLYCYFNDDEIQNYIKQNATSSTMPAINFSLLYDRLIAIPNKEKLIEFDRIIENTRLKLLEIKKENEKLEELRDTLLPKLMNGEIDLDKIEI